MKRTLERELKVPEVAEREALGTSPALQDCHVVALSLLSSGQPAAGVESVSCVVFLGEACQLGLARGDNSGWEPHGIDRENPCAE